MLPDDYMNGWRAALRGRKYSSKASLMWRLGWADFILTNSEELNWYD